MKNVKIIFSVFLIAILISCSKEESTNPITEAQTDVHIAGSVLNSNNKRVPAIWKNGILTILPSDANVSTIASKVVVNENDVYAINDATAGSYNILLWKNGIVTEIASDGRAEELIVDNGNVYILGRVGNVIQYWKNGVPTILTNNHSFNFVSNMVVSNGDVYVAGSENNGSKSIAKLWKNGAATVISNTSLNSYVNSLTVNGSETNILYRENTGAGTVNYKVWKNGNSTTLESGMVDDGSIGRGKLISDKNNIHIVTSQDITPDNSKIVYWKNGLKSDITSGITRAFETDMEVLRDDVHILGNERNPGPANKYALKYWKNGQVTILTDGANRVFNSSMAISKNNDVHIVGDGIYYKNNVATTLTGLNPEGVYIFTVN